MLNLIVYCFLEPLLSALQLALVLSDVHALAVQERVPIFSTTADAWLLPLGEHRLVLATLERFSQLYSRFLDAKLAEDLPLRRGHDAVDRLQANGLVGRLDDLHLPGPAHGRLQFHVLQGRVLLPSMLLDGRPWLNRSCLGVGKSGRAALSVQ